MRISDWSSDVCSSDLITIEDESGIVNALLWARHFERQRRAVMASRPMLIEGEVQRSKEGVVHLMASRVVDHTAMLDALGDERSAEHTSELQSLMRISYAVFCLKKKKNKEKLTNEAR